MTSLTQGLNTRGGSITQELNTSSLIEVIEVEAAIPVGVVGDWFVRRGRDEPLIGPFQYNEADSHARYLSTEEGYAEVVTFLGERAGDPITVPARLFVDGLYAEGKRFLGGRAAQFHSDRKLIEDLV